MEIAAATAATATATAQNIHMNTYTQFTRNDS